MSRSSMARHAGWAVGATNASLLIAGAALISLFVYRHPGALPTHTVVSLFYNVPLALAFAVIGVAIVGRLPAHPIGWLFGLVGFTISFGFFTEGYAAWGSPGLAWVLWLWTVSTGATFFGLAMALLLFPTGRPGSSRWGWLARLLWVYLVVAVLVTAVAPWPRDDDFLVVQVLDRRGEWPAHNPLAWDGLGWLTDVGALVVPVGAVLLLGSLLSLFPRWRGSVGDERQQIKWLGLAGLLATLVVLVGLVQSLAGGMPEDDPVAELVGNALFILIIGGIPVAIGLGITRHRLYDIDRILSRTIVYGALTGLIGAVYVVGVVAVGDLIGRQPGVSTLFGLVATGGIAVAFAPLRTRLQKLADRWVYGERAVPYQVMTRFGQELGEVIDPASVLERIAETAGRSLAAGTARITVTLPDGSTSTTSWGDHGSGRGTETIVPIRDDGEAIGEIGVTASDLRSADIAVLEHIGAVSTAALRNVRLLADLESLYATIQRQNQDIAASKTRLITVASEERRRLREHIADRLEPDLRRLAKELPVLAERVDTAPEQVAGGCERLANRAIRLVEEIRAISRGILPPLLADRGLASALRALLRRLDLEASFGIEPAMDGERYPAGIETTAYLSCQAIVTAATRGAEAEIGVRLWRDSDRLHFSVARTGDAPGLSDDPDLMTARDRLAIVDGEIRISRGDGRTIVLGTVPLGPTVETSPVRTPR